MTGLPFDHPERALSAAEQRDRDALAGPLTVLRAYLRACPVSDTFAEGTEHWTPIRPARRTVPAATGGELHPDVTELYVSPELAHRAALRQRFSYRLPAGVGAGSVTPGTLADAAVFMGGRVAATLRGAGETDRRSPHRNLTGWYRLSREMVLRLREGHFVPSLAGLPGGESRDGAASPRLAARRRTTRVSSEALRTVVTDMLRSRPPTVLAGRALGEARPLACRPRGRPSPGGTWVTGRVLVAVPALAEFVAAEGPRHAVPSTSLAALGSMVAAMTTTYPECFALVSHVRAPDRTGAVRGAWGWLRCDLAALGCEALDPEPLRRELSAYIDRQRAEYFVEQGGALRSARSAADAGHRPGTTTEGR